MPNEVLYIHPDKLKRLGPTYLDGEHRVEGVEAKTPWNPNGNAVDLAASQRAEVKRQRDASDDPPEGEIGSAWPRDRLFAFYQDGLVFEQGPIETAAIEDMLAKDGIARSVEQVLTLPLRAINWTIDPAKGDGGERDFVDDMLNRKPEMGGMRVPMETVLGQMTAARLFKRAHFEKVWRVDADDKVRLDKLAYRPPTTCYLARSAKDASFQGFMQWTWIGMNFVRVIIPKNKAFVFINGTHRDPIQGVSDVEVAYNAWVSKQKLRFLWFAYLEQEVNPKKILKDTDESRGQKAANKVAAMKGGSVLAMQTDQTLDLLQTNSAGAAQFAAAMGYLDQEILNSVLAGFLGLTQQATGMALAGGTAAAKGSFALSQDQSDFFLQASQACLNEMGAAFTTDVIADAVRYNFGPKAAVPTLKFGDLSETDAADKAFALLQAIASAATPTDLLPWAFLDELVVVVAKALNIDTDKVNAALLGQQHDPSHTPAEDSPGMSPADVHGVIDKATQMVGAASGYPAVPVPAGA